MFNTIPSLDLSLFNDEDAQAKKAFVKKLGDGFSEVGFVSVKNHGLTDQLQQKLFDVSQSFFEQKDDIKQAAEKPELFGQRGYVGKEKEHAQEAKKPDLKEFYHIGQENYGENIWPEKLPEFKAPCLEVFQKMEDIGITLLRAIALYLGLDEHYFDDKAGGGNSILRLIHYFPIKDVSKVKAGAVRAGAHGDINLITLLMGASADGLELLRKDGKWIPVTAVPGHLVVNVGDMLSRLTNDKLTSTIHRVVNPNPEAMTKPRYSFPFFMHPKPEMDLSCLESCVNKENPKKFPDITAGEFLTQRLEEIGLKA